MRVEEDRIHKEMESKSKKSKKNKTSDFQQVATDIASDTKTDAVVYREGCLQVDDDPQKEKDQKKKKKKSKSGEGIHKEAPSALETVSANLSEGDKSKRKNKNKKKKKDRHDEIVIEHIDDGTLEKDSLEVDDEVQMEKERKKKWKSNINFEESVTEMEDGEEFTEIQKVARGENDAKGRKSKREEKIVGGVVGESVVCSERENVEKVEKKKRKREKQKENDNLCDGETDTQLTLSKTIGGEDEVGSKGKKKKKGNEVENGSEDPQPKRKSKNASFSGDGDEYTENKKTSKKEKDGKGRKSKGERKTEDGGVGELMVCSEGENVDKIEKKKKKRKREMQKENDNLAEKDLGDGEIDGQSSLNKTIGGEDKVASKGKKNKKTSAAENGSEDPKPKKKLKKVSFSSEVEVFPSTVQGKWFTKKEDEIVKQSVLNYIETHGLGDEGLNMVMHCKAYPGVKNCWKEIGSALPHRPYTAIYYRAHNLFERSDTSNWTEEDLEFLKKAQKEHGNDWKAIAAELGRHRVHVKDAWRRIKLPNQKKGHWSQQEYQNLYDLVNLDLQMKLDADVKLSKHGMLRDNIPWTAISDKLTTRSDALCCMKWYRQLTSSMVAEGLWADADDYRLIGALYDMDASCEGDVDWDNLLEHRSGDVCRKRWNQMVLHIGFHGCKPFAEQVEALAQRYCPNLAETREAWDNKPVTQ